MTSKGHFSRSDPGDGLSTPSAALAQISLRFAKPAAEAAPVGKTPVIETKDDEPPFDPRPLHIIIAERKAGIDAQFDEFYKLSKRIARVDEDEAEWYNGLADARKNRDDAVKKQDSIALEKFKQAVAAPAVVEQPAPAAKTSKTVTKRPSSISDIFVVPKKKACIDKKIVEESPKSNLLLVAYESSDED